MRNGNLTNGADAIIEHLAGHGTGFVMNGLNNTSVDDMFKAVEEKYGRAPDVSITPE